MRAISSLNAKFDKLLTVEDFNKLEADLQRKMEINTHELRNELGSKFKAEMQAHSDRMNEMVSEVRAQVSASSGRAKTGRNDIQ